MSRLLQIETFFLDNSLYLEHMNIYETERMSEYLKILKTFKKKIKIIKTEINIIVY